MHSHSEHQKSVETNSNCGCGHTHDKHQTGCSNLATAANSDAISHDSVSEHSHHDGESCSHTHADEADEESDRLDTTIVSGTQRFSWQVKGMDCPSCARKIENAISGLDGVEKVKVLFTTEKLVVDARADVRSLVQKAVIATGFSLVNTQTTAGQKNVATESRLREYLPLALLSTLMLISWGLSFFNTELSQTAFTITTIVGLIPFVIKSWKLIRSGTPFAIETLMSVAAIGAVFIGATAEAAMVLL
ncbi:cation transporter, partial [Yersinia pestis]